MSRKDRPAYFDHHVALLSFLRSIEPCRDAVRVHFLNDGEIQRERLGLMLNRGEVIDAGGVGNCSSHRAALSLAERLDTGGEDVVYFSEDDYIYLTDAFSQLLAAASEFRQVNSSALVSADDRAAGRSSRRYAGPALGRDQQRHDDVRRPRGAARGRCLDSLARDASYVPARSDDLADSAGRAALPLCACAHGRADRQP